MKVSVFNKMSKWGLGLCFISFFAGDILKILGVGLVFQQTAITNAFGFLGLAFVILGGVEALLEAIQKKSSPSGATSGSKVARKPLDNDFADELDTSSSKDALAKYKALSEKSRK